MRGERGRRRCARHLLLPPFLCRPGRVHGSSSLRVTAGPVTPPAAVIGHALSGVAVFDIGAPPAGAVANGVRPAARAIPAGETAGAAAGVTCPKFRTTAV